MLALEFRINRERQHRRSSVPEPPDVAPGEAFQPAWDDEGFRSAQLYSWSALGTARIYWAVNLSVPCVAIPLAGV